MIPSFLVKIDKLPINSNGKIDRGRLPPPDSEALFRAAYVKPQDERQAAIARIWRDVLDIEQIGINDNFFLIGGRFAQRRRGSLDDRTPGDICRSVSESDGQKSCGSDRP